MCNRQKPVSLEEIKDVTAEMKYHGDALIRLVNKLNRDGYLTKEERELAMDHTKFIEANKKLVSDFYRPAMVIE